MPIALRLYLLEDWAQDAARRAQAKVPESIAFETKGDIALAQIDAARATAYASAWCWQTPAMAVPQAFALVHHGRRYAALFSPRFAP